MSEVSRVSFCPFSVRVCRLVADCDRGVAGYEPGRNGDCGRELDFAGVGVLHCYRSGASCDSASYNKTAHPGLSGWAVLFRGAMTIDGRGSPPS